MIVKRIKQWRANRRAQKERGAVALENLGMALQDIQRSLQSFDQTFNEITNRYWNESSRALLIRSLKPTGLTIYNCMSCKLAYIDRPHQCSCGEANNFHQSILR